MTCINIKLLSISRFQLKKERYITPALEFRLTRLKRSFNSRGEVMNLLSCTQGGMLQVSYFWQLSHTKRKVSKISFISTSIKCHISYFFNKLVRKRARDATTSTTHTRDVLMKARRKEILTIFKKNQKNILSNIEHQGEVSMGQRHWWYTIFCKR